MRRINLLLFIAAVVAWSPASLADSNNIFGIHFWGSGASGIMNGRQGYCVLNVWPGVRDKTDWSDIRSACINARNDGFVPIVRLNWWAGQTVPANNDWTGRFNFAWKCREAAENLRDVCNIYQIGNEMNASWEGAIPASWYLWCFNGYDSNNCYTQIHNVQSNAIVIMGAVAPWNPDTNATGPYNNTYEKWKNYWYYLVNNSGLAVDGWAIHAYGGRQNGQPGNSGYDPDPRDDCNAPYTVSTATIDVSWGFNCFRYFVDEIATAQGDLNKPIFITETNTAATAVPSVSYQAGWINAAYEAIDTYNKNHYQKIRALCWFVYDPAGAWTDYSLCCGGGQMPQARTDYQNTTSAYNYQWGSNTPDAYCYLIDTGASNPSSGDPNQIVLSSYLGKWEGWQGDGVNWYTSGPFGWADYWVITQSRTLYASQDGTYYFNTTSDDGSWLWVDGKLVVNNGGLHGQQTATGSIDLTAGYHWVYVKFFEWGGDAYTAYQYQPPGQGWQNIPDAHAPKGNALVYNLNAGASDLNSHDFTRIVAGSYVGSFSWNGVAKNWGSSGPLGKTDYWIIMQPFVFWVATSGTYQFRTGSDDGSWLWIDGQTVVDNYGVGPLTWAYGSKYLVRGWHTGFFKFFDKTGSAYSCYQWLPPNRGGGNIYDPMPVY
jgi:hypothetical protein